jgi:uncharacterized protein YciI
MAEPEITDDFIQGKISSGKQYCLFLYLSGPNRNQSEAESEKLQQKHLRYLFKLRDDGILILNGPVTDKSPLRGIGIFNCTDKNAAKQLLDADPAVKAGRLIYEVYSWFGLPGDSLSGN